jgi:hypothetical protein
MTELNPVFDEVLVLVPAISAAGGGSGQFHAPSSGAANSPILLSIGEIQNAFDVKFRPEQGVGGLF